MGLYVPYIGVKQSKILGMCKLYGQINTEIITKLYKGNRSQAVKSVKSLEKKGFLYRVGMGIFIIHPHAKIDWTEVQKEGKQKEEEDGN